MTVETANRSPTQQIDCENTLIGPAVPPLTDPERTAGVLTPAQTFAGVKLGPGTLYGAITRLEQQGWIRPVQSTDRRRPYTITPSGRGYLQEQLAGLQQVVKTGLARLKHA